MEVTGKRVNYEPGLVWLPLKVKVVTCESEWRTVSAWIRLSLEDENGKF